MRRASERSYVGTATDGEQNVQVGPREKEQAAVSLSMEEDTAHDEMDGETESFWKRFTRRVIRDIIGIDEPLLSIICGESLPSGTTTPSRPLVNEQGAISCANGDILAAFHSHPPWEDRLFDRIARELGTLVHQLSEHPGAFSTFFRAQQATDYAGFTPALTEPDSRASVIPDTANLASTTNHQFSPTLQQTDASTHAALWGIEEEQAGFSDPEEVLAHRLEAERLKRERDYWEKELDVKMVFGFLRNRFVPSSRSNTSRNIATSSTQDPAARAALIRHHHPLVSRSHEQRLHLQRRRGSLLLPHHRSTSLGSVKRPGSSCASQSTKKRGSGSSRNYWDLGGSVGSGSAIGASAGIGVWGEV